MLVEINSDVFVRASDVVSVTKMESSDPHLDGRWVAKVEHEYGIHTYEVPASEVRILVQTINRFLEK